MIKTFSTLLFVFITIICGAQTERLPNNINKFYILGFFKDFDTDLSKDESEIAKFITQDIEIIMNKYYEMYSNRDNLDIWIAQRPDLTFRELQDHIKQTQEQLDFYVYGQITYPKTSYPRYKSEEALYIFLRFQLRSNSRIFSCRIRINEDGIYNNIYREHQIENKLIQQIFPIPKTIDDILSELNKKTTRLNNLNNQDKNYSELLSDIIYIYIDLLSPNKYPVDKTSKNKIINELNKLISSYEVIINYNFNSLNNLMEKPNISNLDERIGLLNQIIQMQYNLITFYNFIDNQKRVNQVLIGIENNNVKLKTLNYEKNN